MDPAPRAPTIDDNPESELRRRTSSGNKNKYEDANQAHSDANGKTRDPAMMIWFGGGELERRVGIKSHCRSMNQEGKWPEEREGERDRRRRVSGHRLSALHSPSGDGLK